jgi:poly [ADP-ribose] polymerase
MQEGWKKSGQKVGNVVELWHGTKASNLLSILKCGLIIPPSNASFCTGRMFGNGIYFSDQSTKSLNYAYGYWSGRTDNNCFMFLADVAMGKHYVPKSAGEHLPKPGYDSTYAKAGVSGVINNEMIVYKTYQVNLRFLVEFAPTR